MVTFLKKVVSVVDVNGGFISSTSPPRASSVVVATTIFKGNEGAKGATPPLPLGLEDTVACVPITYSYKNPKPYTFPPNVGSKPDDRDGFV